MNDLKSRDLEQNPLPFVALGNELALSAPLRWLSLGFRDTRPALLASVGYDVVMSGLIMAVTVMALKFGSAWIMLSLLCGFVFITPIACVGTYAIDLS